MLKNIILTMVLFSLFSGSLFAQLPDPLPEQFTVRQRWFSWTSDFDIETKEYKLGYVHRKIFSWTTEYEFRDIYNQLEANAKARWFSWGTTFDVMDALNQPLGIVEERIFTFFPTFDIISPSGDKLAIAVMNFWGTRYVLIDSITGSSMVTLSRPFFRWKDNWTVTIENPILFNQKQIDPRLFIIVMAFQSDRELWKRQRSRSKLNAPHYAFTRKELSLFKKSTNSTKSFLNEFNALREELVAYRTRLTSIDPLESDFEQVEEIMEAKLKSIDSSHIEKTEEAWIVAGIKFLLPFIDSNELTDAQKNALYLLIEYQLYKSNYSTQQVSVDSPDA